MDTSEFYWTQYSTYLQQDNGDDGHLRTQPGEQTLELPTLTNQVTVNNNGYQAHGLHRSLMYRERERKREREKRKGRCDHLPPWCGLEDPLTFFQNQTTDLPLSDVLHSLSEGSLEAGTELQGIAADLNDVVDKSAHGRQGKRRREEHHVAKLNKHLLVVLKRILLKSDIIKQY